MIPLSNTFSYFCASVPMSEKDLKEYLQEPVAALPPAIVAALPKISILLVPYLERANGRERAKAKAESSGEFVSIERPPEGRLSNFTQLRLGEETVLAFALKDQEVAEYHYRFYHQLADLMGNHWTEAVETAFCRVLREELTADVHGEVDEPSWRLKQALKRPPRARSGKPFRDYARQSFIDTLTLYLHGICCDIDVDTGPRQLPSRYLRKRLIALEEFFPPPKGLGCSPINSRPERACGRASRRRSRSQLRITIDATPTLIRSAGVKNYTYHWIRHLWRAAQSEEIRAFPYLHHLDHLDHEHSALDRGQTFSRLVLIHLLKFVGSPLLDLTIGDADVFHTSNQVRCAPRRAKLTATVHDFTCWLMRLEFHTRGQDSSRSRVRRSHS